MSIKTDHLKTTGIAVISAIALAVTALAILSTFEEPQPVDWTPYETPVDVLTEDGAAIRGQVGRRWDASRQRYIYRSWSEQDAIAFEIRKRAF